MKPEQLEIDRLRRVKLLEDAGAIMGYRTVLDRPSVGLGLTLFAGIRVVRHTDANAEAFVNAVLAMPEMVASHLVSGDVNFLIEIVVPDMSTYESTVLRHFLSMPAVRNIRSNFAMRNYKADGPLPIDTK